MGVPDQSVTAGVWQHCATVIQLRQVIVSREVNRFALAEVLLLNRGKVITIDK